MDRISDSGSDDLGSIPGGVTDIGTEKTSERITDDYPYLFYT